MGVKINYGQKKQMPFRDASGNPVLDASGQPVVGTFVYALSTKRAGTQASLGSGWINIDAIKAPYQRYLSGAPIDRPQPDNWGPGDPTGQGIELCIVGKSPAEYPVYYHKVVPCGTKKNEQVGDYLTRPGGVVNMLYALPGAGGVSNDTVKVGTHFWRLPPDGEPKPAKINIYEACTTRVVGEMVFVYGYIKNPGGARRFGWIAEDALGPCPST